MAESPAEAVARASRVIARLGLTIGTVGHVSARLPDGDLMAIRGKSDDEAGLASTRAQDVAVADLDGQPIEVVPGLRVPSECFIHCGIYRANSDVNAVIHAHLRSAVLVEALDRPIVPPFAAYEIVGSRMAVDGLAVFQNPAMVDNPEIGAEFAAALGTAPAALMRGHGATVVGATLEEAVVRLVALDELCSMTLDMVRLGAAPKISADDVLAMTAKIGSGRARGVASQQVMFAGMFKELLERTGERR